MKKISGILFFVFVWSITQLSAQVENVIVEKYYISDSNDATDTIGGGLPDRSTTYRIYIDLIAGSKLTKIYGDINHAFKISSTDVFFNNEADGQTFAKDFSKVRLGENTVALDSWLTLGQTTRNAAKTYFGILKSDDTDGSIIGGANNDGGSAAIADGLLANNDPAAGGPLTEADGMDTMSQLPTNWADYGIIDIASGVDSTIFGSAKSGKEFISYDAGLQNSGVSGVDPDSNRVLVAQLTTKGQLSFELNVEVIDTNGIAIKYVANDSILLQGEVLSRSLKYPFAQVCGCPDPRYLEYIGDRDCDALDSCRNLIVYGCMDTMACNFNPDANFNLQSLCCYPGFCNDRDISVVCPGLTYKMHRSLPFNLFPSPAKNQITFQSPSFGGAAISYSIYNMTGEIIFRQNVGSSYSPIELNIDLSFLNAGIYIFQVESGSLTDRAIFIKE